jgi:FkbM family methyltransferase
MFKLPIDQLSKYRLQNLSRIGFKPRMILDIGAHHGDWAKEIASIFPDSSIFMVEGNSDCEEKLSQVGYPYSISLLSDRFKSVPFYKHNGFYTTGDSIYKENTEAYSKENSEVTILHCCTLDDIVDRYNLQNIDMIKMDVQGSEMDIMKGSLATIQKAQVVLLELQLIEYNTGAPMFIEMIVFMDSIGFKVYDVIELHYTSDHELIQVDILFMRKDLVL